MSWLRKHKKYKRPKKPFDKKRIDEEEVLVKSYGLKNKREIWKAEAAVSRVRGIAKKLITAEAEEQEKLFKKLNKEGFAVSNILDVLALDKEDWLKRRLQSVVVKKKLARTPLQARQLIVHKYVKIGSRIVNIPSYRVKVEEEKNISLVEKKVKKIKKENNNEESMEVLEEHGEE